MCYSHFGNGDRNGAITIVQTFIVFFFKYEGAGATHYKFVWNEGGGMAALTSLSLIIMYCVFLND